jgi:hypothetical protein
MHSTIQIEGKLFRDREGRHVILRGVNLGGDCKVPVSPDGHTYLRTDFADHRNVSFVGRPFPLDEADEHFGRLQRWGFNCLRLLTTWEAVEHAGPGIYDEDYLDYLAAIARRADNFGFHIFIDFHQDVWARMSGGDGAPGWTFEVAGLDFTKFDTAEAAHVMAYKYDADTGGRQDSYPQMSWGANYRMPANAIMWTLFFAGEAFAPSALVEGRNVGTYLQDHYLGSMRAVAERVADIPHVIGFDTLNEPGSGWIGQHLDERRGLLRGPAWSPLDALAVASGIPRTLPLLESGERLVNQQGISIWREGATDPFREAGVWGVTSGGEPVALRPDHFQMFGGESLDFGRDIMRPFYHRVASTVRAVRNDWLIFAEADPFGGHGLPEGCPERTVNASHWYDLATLVTKRFEPWSTKDLLTGEVYMGREAVTQGYVSGLQRVAGFGDTLNGGAPTLIGEFGIPFDLNDAEAYSKWSQGNHSPEIWQAHVSALTAMYDALDTLLLSSTQWNYTTSNGNNPMVGDGWNQEDLSIWSNDQVLQDAACNPDAGGRALEGFCRPFVHAAQGKLMSQTWDGGSAVFDCSIDIDENITAPTEIFIPAGYTVSAVYRDDVICTWHQREQVICLKEKSSGPPASFKVHLQKN